MIVATGNRKKFLNDKVSKTGDLTADPWHFLELNSTIKTLPYFVIDRDVMFIEKTYYEVYYEASQKKCFIL